jgi:hypothetical protein
LEGSAKEASYTQLAAAVHTAAALPGGLLLQSLKTCSLSVFSAAASCHSLTSLDLSLGRNWLFSDARAAVSSITGMAADYQIHDC